MSEHTWGYELDDRDHVRAVLPGWDDFAHENGAPGALSERVVGRPLWDFVAGVETRHVLSRILQRVRDRGAAVEVPFHCDGPSVHREMLFRAAPGEAGCVAITTVLVREEPRDPARVQRPVPREGEFLRMCSWCNRMDVGAGEWAEVGVAARQMRLFVRAALPEITHGICAGCEQLLEERLDDAPAPPPVDLALA